VRINGLESSEWQLDLEVLRAKVAGVRLPKAESIAALEPVEKALAAREERLGLARGTFEMTCLIESARGLLAAQELAAHPRVSRLAFGAADFVADIGASPSLPAATLAARSQLVYVSRAAGLLPPIAPVWTEIENEAGLRAAVRENSR
jgi:citrate lyase subunit beta/citryl-CoA lyase